MKTQMVVLLILTMMGWSCGTNSKQQQETTTQTVQLPTLTEAQQAEGWRLLFDGKTLEGWRIFNNYPNNSWEVENGTLHCKAPDESDDGEDNLRSDIMTEHQFADFELSLEWKVSPEANSGIMFRVTEAFPQPYHSGSEYQIIDDVGYPGELKEVNKTAANYDMHVATNKTLKPVGEWNATRLIVQGNHVEHWLNGSKVLEYELQSDDWKNRVQNSKWKEHEGYGQSPKGHIDLQDHGSEVWFRNIMIREL